jgi:hypothetical protein
MHVIIMFVFPMLTAALPRQHRTAGRRRGERMNFFTQLALFSCE